MQKDRESVKIRLPQDIVQNLLSCKALTGLPYITVLRKATDEFMSSNQTNVDEARASADGRRTGQPNKIAQPFKIEKEWNTTVQEYAKTISEKTTATDVFTQALINYFKKQ